MSDRSAQMAATKTFALVDASPPLSKEHIKKVVMDATIRMCIADGMENYGCRSEMIASMPATRRMIRT